MATTTILRNPLTTRSHSQQAATPGPSLQRGRKSTSIKRAHSPEPAADTQGAAKRAKAAAPEPVASPTQDKKLRRAERDQEFRDKYGRAFPKWIFYFDIETVASAVKDPLIKRVTQMGARVEDFFSKEVTHFITQEVIEKPGNKENILKSRRGQNAAPPQLDSPIRLRTRAADNGLSELLQKAITFELKIWTTEKLESVLDRCEPLNRPAVPNASAQALEALLKAEKLNGTAERDPTQKRHNYDYFDKGSHFVLVEDMRQELATIVAEQYPMRTRDGKKVTYPILYCHPLSRGPFVPYDEKEERRREKQDRTERERSQEIRRRKLRLIEFEREKTKKAEMESRRRGELRRTQSMANLRRRATFNGQGNEGFVDLDAEYEDGDVDGDFLESAAASGYLASNAYTAASGNSVSITSTTGTTSTSGLPLRSHLTQSLREKLGQEVVTSRRVPVAAMRRESTMGPPPLPTDRTRLLRKSRSTNTMRLPKRIETSKPGYCESCRRKFADFRHHTRGRRHRKFAMNDDNFAALDAILSRVKRPVLEMEDDALFFDAPADEEDLDSPVDLPSNWVDLDGNLDEEI